MLRQAFYCGIFLLGCALPLSAQSTKSPPKPPPPPQLGERAYTQQAAAAEFRANTNYHIACAKDGATLDELDKAYKPLSDAASDLGKAILAEFKNIPEMREQLDLANHLTKTYYALLKSQKDYEEELKAKAAYDAAWAKYDDLQLKWGKKIMDEIYPGGSEAGDTRYCDPHEKLSMAKAVEDTRKFKEKAAAAAAAQKTATGNAAGDCNRGTGIDGALDKETCEMKSGNK